ncbi:MAG: hypothetical protein JXB39_02875 [Deltaproteobacteria bacterium]|nr:hypothetical protein [Deltaproteobacteria bacterium]
MSPPYEPAPPHREIGPTLARSWELFKEHAGILLGATLTIGVASGVLSGITQIVQALLQPSGEDAARALPGLVGLLLALLSWVVQTFLTLGYVRLLLHGVRGEPAAFGDLFTAAPVLVPGLVAGLLVGLATLAGTCLLVVPGVVVALGTLWVNWVLVDQGLGPIEAVRESWRLANGEKGHLFLWVLVACVVAIVGLLACGVGLLVALPVLGLGTTILYDDRVRSKRRDGRL